MFGLWKGVCSPSVPSEKHSLHKSLIEEGSLESASVPRKESVCSIVGK